MLENDADVNLQTKTGNTALMAAVSKGNHQIVQALLIKGVCKF
ncbi:ankyrin repeat domain-containing protein [Paremcibacter congregatus]